MGKFKNKNQSKSKTKKNSKKTPEHKKVEKKTKIKTKKNMETKIKAIVAKTGVSEEIAKLNIVDTLNAKKSLKQLLVNQSASENVSSLEKENIAVTSTKRKDSRNKKNSAKLLNEPSIPDDVKIEGNASQLKPTDVKRHDEDIESTLFVGNLPQNIKKQQVANLFKDYGSVKSVRIRTALGKKLFKHKMRHETESLIAFVKMDTPDSVEKALQLTGTIFHGRHIRVTRAKLESAIDETLAKRTIFVGNLRYSATEDKLHELFSTCGEVESVRTIKNERGCNGVAFVCFKKAESVGLSIELRNTILDDRPIHVERYMKNKESNSKNRNITQGRVKDSNVERKNKEGKKKTAFRGIKMGRKKEYIKKKKQANSREKRLAKKIAPRLR